MNDSGKKDKAMTPLATADMEAFDALVSLGYSGPEAKIALSGVDEKITDSGQRVKTALKNLAKK